MSKSQKSLLFLFGTSLALLVVVGFAVYLGAPLHIAKIEVEGWSFHNTTVAILGPLALVFATFLAIVCIVAVIDKWFDSFITSWLSKWQKPATVDMPLEPAILREKVMSIVAQALGVGVAEVTEETRIGPHLRQITPHVAVVAKRIVMVGTNDNVGDLLKEVSAK